MRQKSTILLTLCVLLFTTILAACSQISSVTFTETKTAYQKAEVLLEAVLPSALPAETKMQLEVLDDVTGLPYNPTRIDMIQKDERTYYAKTTFSVGSIVKYRYLKTSQSSTAEYTSTGEPVRFRALKVTGPLVLYDTIAAWQDEPYLGNIGRIRGQLTDSVDNTPLPNLLVTAEGIQTLTASDGSFVIEGLTPGTHNLVVFALDGTYEEFQQSALIAENATTPVQISLVKRPLVDVTFEVELPSATDINTGLRIATNFYSLGNLYADTYAGVSALAADLPVLQTNSNGIFSLKLSLPAGSYLNYKFTLGDGFWNGELNPDGSFRVRELIVPNKAITVKSIVASLHPENSAPVTFKVVVPSETPVEDSVSLQLNPYQWTAPLPMAKLDAQTWSYTLYNPQSYFGEIAFRYCRNTACDLTSEVEPAAGTQPRTFTPNAIAQSVQSTVAQWQSLNPSTGPTSVTTEVAGTPPRTDLLTGYEIDPAGAVSSRSFEQTTYASIAATGANWLILDPTWTVSGSKLPVLAPIPGSDLLWSDVLSSALKVQQACLALAIFPRINYPVDGTTYWNTAPTNQGWWQTWFDAYHRFVIQNADAATLSGASAIILGDPGMSSTMQNTVLPDGTPANTPVDEQAQWIQLVKDVRARYSGAIIGVLDLQTPGEEIPAWLNEVDALYIIIRPEISAEAMTSFSAILSEAGAYLDNVVQPVATRFNKPVIIGLNVQSTSDAYLGCSAAEVNCLVDQTPAGSATNISLDTQAKIYNAFVMGTGSRTWIGGFFSRGYQSAGSLQDNSDSVHGKPANDVLWYWYHFLAGKSQ